MPKDIFCHDYSTCDAKIVLEFIKKLTLKAKVTTTADDLLIFFFFLRK